MAKKIVLADDITGEDGEDVKTVLFAVGGEYYEIDLNEKNATAFAKAFGIYTEKGRTVTQLAFRANFHRADGAQVTTTEESPDENKAIREWATANGIEVSERGRIAAEVKTAYYKAQAEKAKEAAGEDNKDAS